MSGSNGSPPDRIDAVRTEQPDSYGDDAHMQSASNSPECRPVRTEQASPSTTPLAVGGQAREFTAHLLDAALSRRWEDGEEWASNRSLAGRCGNTESVVRRWRNGEKSIPLAALRVLPMPLASELARGLLADRGGVQRPLVGLRDALERLERPVSADDLAEVKRALREARDRINARLDRFDEENK